MPQHTPEEQAKNSAGGAPAPGGGAPDPGQGPPGNTPEQAQEQDPSNLLEPIQQASDAIVQIGGPEALMTVLQQGLEQLMQQQQPQQQGPQIPSAAPTPGGEGFGPAFG